MSKILGGENLEKYNTYMPYAPKTVDEIKDRLADIRRCMSIERVREFIGPILDANFVKEKFPHAQDGSQQNTTTINQLDDFFVAYFVSIFPAFLSKDDAEIMLMVYGFLDGFDGKLKERREKYWEYAHRDNRRLNGKKGRNQKDKDNLMRGIENDIIRELATTLNKEIDNQEKMSKFADKVYEAFSNGEIPKKIPINNIIVQKDGSTPEISQNKVQHYKRIIYKISICGKIIHTDTEKILISGDVDEECEKIFDITKEVVGAIIASVACLVTFFFIVREFQSYNLFKDVRNTEYAIEGKLQKNTPEENHSHEKGLLSDPKPQFNDDSNRETVDLGTAGEIIEPDYYSLGNIDLYVEDTGKKRKFDIASLGGNNGNK